MKARIDRSWQRFGSVVLAGSPLRLFRTTGRGSEVLDAIEQATEVAMSTLVERLLDADAIHPVIDPGTQSQFGRGDVTVVTPHLRASAASQAAEDEGATVDDGSTPPLTGAAVRLESNSGPAVARNAGRAVVETALIAFLDADVDVPDGWFEGLLAHFDDPGVGLVAPRVTGESGSPLDLGPEPARIRAGSRVSYVPGAALVVRTAAFDAVGGFDPTLRLGEDVDFVWRLDQAGWRCRYEPAVTVWHRPRRTWPDRLRQHAGYGTSAAPLALRHPGLLTPWRSNGWTAFVWVAAVGGQTAIASLVAVASSLALRRKLPDVPPSASFGLALRGHLLAGRQLSSAVRRVWWPVVAVGALVSKRLRWLAAAALLADLRAAPNDLAYGWGVWVGMWRRRTWAPIVPRLSAWPGRRSGPATHRRPMGRQPPGGLRPVPGEGAR